MYRPVARNSLRRQITRTCQSSPRLTIVAIISLLILTLLFWRGGRSKRVIDGHQFPVVLVAVLDTSRPDQTSIIERVLENRREYANAHGLFSTFKRMESNIRV